MVLPTQTGLLLEAVKVGKVFTLTEVVAEIVQAPAPTVTVYMPAFAIVIPAIVGFCWVEENELPLQLKLVPLLTAERLSVLPSQTGPLLEAVSVSEALITTGVVAVAMQPFELVAVTVYVPAIAVVTLGRDGFCWVDEKPEGPAQAKATPSPVAVKSSV